MKLLKKKVPALFLILLVVLSLTVPALAASSTDTAAAPAAAETAQTQSDATGSKSIAAGIAIGLAAAGGAVAEFFPLFFDGFQGVKAVFQSHIAFGEGVGGQIFRRGFAA